MTNQPPQPDPNAANSPAEPHENLVAYLDGELPEAAVRDVEQQLAQNPVLRRNVEAYQKAWELLDELPHIKATEQFTTKTVASLKIEPPPAAISKSNSIAIATDDQAVSRRRATRRGLVDGKAKPQAIAVWFAGLAISAAAGFLITNRLVPSPAERLLQDFPVIEKWDKFKEVGSLEFLMQYRELKKGGADREPPP